MSCQGVSSYRNPDGLVFDHRSSVRNVGAIIVKDEVVMKIGKVTDLLNSLTKQQNQARTNSTTGEVRPTHVPQSEAAKVAADFGTGAADRSQKVADLKDRHNKGELKYDSTEVAKAFYRDMLV